MNGLPPGLAGYALARQQQEQGAMNQLQQAQGVVSLQGAMQAQQEKAKLQELLAASGGDPEKAVEVAIKSGNVTAAHHLAPLARMAQERKQADETKRGLAELYGMGGQPNQNPMIPGPGASVMAGSGSTVPAAPQANPAAAKNARREQLMRMSMLYANNPTMQARIQGEIGKLDEAEKPAQLSQLGRLMAERDKYPVGSKEYQIYDQAITKFQPGGVTVNMHPNAPLIPGKPAQNKVDEGLLDAGMRLQALGAIERQFKPEYQNLGPRLSALGLSLKDKVGLTELDPNEKKFLTEFSAYKRNAINSMNDYIKSVTGAAMSNEEAKRILKGMPNPGEGIFDGDSPTEFKAKMDDAIKQTRLAEARLVYIKRNGLNIGDVDLDRMPRLMNERGAEIEGKIKQQQPNISPADLRKLVKRNLAQEFGLIE